MDLYDRISELGKRRGIFYPSFEIYGGVSGFFDYGPVGTILKRNIIDKWRRLFVYNEGMVELESTVIMPEEVFKASGHLAHFTDILTKCTKCGREFRADQLLNELGLEYRDTVKTEDLDMIISGRGCKCPDCGGSLAKAEPFNLMFRLKIGSYGAGQTGYCRPEAGQGQFVDFKRIYASERERLPLGVAQVGRCLRNEVAPRKGPLRLREFTIIDYEIFIDPEDTSYPRINLVEDQNLPILTVEEQLAGYERVVGVTVKEALERGLVKNEVLCYFMALAVRFLEDLGVPFEKQRLREQLPDERAHYSEQTFDQEIWLERWGWTEVSGHAYRTDYDLRSHMTHSGVDLRVYKVFDKPRKVIKFKLRPLIDRLSKDFGSVEGERIARLLSKTDPSIVERELRRKGYYELTGERSVKIRSIHVDIDREEVVEAGRYFIPHVVEPSFGIDRVLYSVLEYAYTERGKRVVLKLPRDIAAIKAAVYPLVVKDGLAEYARRIYRSLVDESFMVKYDESGSIGRRYARADEIGVPICVTVDYQTLKDDTVTLRDLYTWRQVRAGAGDLPRLLREYFGKKLEFDDLGTPFKPSK